MLVAVEESIHLGRIAWFLVAIACSLFLWERRQRLFSMLPIPLCIGWFLIENHLAYRKASRLFMAKMNGGARRRKHMETMKWIQDETDRVYGEATQETLKEGTPFATYSHVLEMPTSSPTDLASLTSKHNRLETALGENPQRFGHLVEDFEIPYIQASNALVASDSDPITLKETNMLLNTHFYHGATSKVIHVLGHRRAWERCCQLMKEMGPLDIKHLLEMHVLLGMHTLHAPKPGATFGTRMGTVVLDGQKVLYPHPAEIEPLLRHLFTTLATHQPLPLLPCSFPPSPHHDSCCEPHTHSDTCPVQGPPPDGPHPVLLATWAYLALLRIRPFALGSGRMARLMASALLLRAGYPPLIVPKDMKASHDRAFEVYCDDGARVSEMMHVVVTCVERALDEMLKKLKA